MVRILFAIFESGWRRVFGSGNYNRVILHIINVLATSLYLWDKDIPLIKVAFVVPVFEFFYWSVGHGSAFDIGRDYPPSEKTITRYKKYFWNKWCEFLVPKKLWYGFGYDFLWMMFRYGIPAVVVAIILENFWFSFSGIIVAFTYAVCWSLYDMGKIKSPTALAEYVAGFFSGLLI